MRPTATVKPGGVFFLRDVPNGFCQMAEADISRKETQEALRRDLDVSRERANAAEEALARKEVRAALIQTWAITERKKMACCAYHDIVILYAVPIYSFWKAVVVGHEGLASAKPRFALLKRDTPW